MNKMIDLAEINEQIRVLEREQRDVRNKLGPLERRYYAISGELRDLIEERDKQVFENRSDSAEIDFELALVGDPGSQAHLRAAERELNKLGLSRSGFYNSRTGQTIVQIKLYKGKPEVTKKTAESLKIILPHIKTSDPTEGKQLSIFEHTFPEYGTYNLHVYDNRIDLIRCTYGHETILKTFTDLDDALNYVENNHWYA